MASTIAAGTTTTTALVYTADTSGVLQLQTNGTTTAVTIDTNQNVGIGATPSSWGSGLKALQINGTVGYLQLANGTGGGYTYWNMYNNGTNNITIATGNIGAYGLNTSGSHVWFNGTGTASTTATLTQAMTLNNSGQLGIGTSSPAYLLDILGGGTSNALMHLNGGSPRKDGYLGTDGAGAWFGDTSNESGNSFYINTTSNCLAFYTNGGNERARIDNAGNLLIAQTSPNSLGVGIGLYNSGGSGSSGTWWNYIGGNSSSAGLYGFSLYSTAASAYRFQVTYSGQIYATSTSISGISDISLKTNIKPLETGLVEINKLQPRRFDWINGDGENIAGFIAQEVQTVLPDLTIDHVHSKDEEGKDVVKLGLKMGDMIPTIVKAIQELSAKVTALEAKVA